MDRALSIAACSRPRPGEEHCGDVCLVATAEPGAAPRCHLRSDVAGDGITRVLDIDRTALLLLAVIDGVGHGRAAKEAALLVLETMLDTPWSDLGQLVRACHRSAAASRGATLGLALLDPEANRLSVIGVGDVTVQLTGQGRAARSSVTPALGSPIKAFPITSGTVGHNLPQRLLVETCTWQPGAQLLLCSDGIDQSFYLSALPEACRSAPKAAVEWILANRRVASDDATAVLMG
jgi:phosphoserine phosphatase RsbX